MGQRVALCAFVVGFAVMATASSRADAAPPPIALTLRVYDTFGVAAAEMKATETVVADIFRAAGFLLSWRRCNGPADAREPPDSCQDLVRPEEVLVRIAAAPPQIAADVLGYSFVEPETGAGILSTVLADRVRQYAARSTIRFATLLGRTIAHEVGHLVLGTNHHSREGLMQSHWSGEHLRRRRPDDARFSRGDATRMAARFRERQTGTAMAALSAEHVTAAVR